MKRKLPSVVYVKNVIESKFSSSEFLTLPMKWLPSQASCQRQKPTFKILPPDLQMLLSLDIHVYLYMLETLTLVYSSITSCNTFASILKFPSPVQSKNWSMILVLCLVLQFHLPNWSWPFLFWHDLVVLMIFLHK